jgi:glutathione S-transferase
MRLHGIPPTRAVRPIWLLNELDLDCEVVTVDLPEGEHRRAPFLALNPMGKVPVLEDGDLVVAESAAIALYLAERYGGGRFVPAAVEDRARMHRWTFFMVSEVEAPLWRMALHSSIYPEAERRPEEIALAKRDCLEMLRPLDRRMADRAFLEGDAPTVADFVAAFTLDWADDAEVLGELPALSDYVRRMYQRPAAPPTIAEAFAVLRAGGIPGRYRSAPPAAAT